MNVARFPADLCTRRVGILSRIKTSPYTQVYTLILILLYAYIKTIRHYAPQGEIY